MLKILIFSYFIIIINADGNFSCGIFKNDQPGKAHVKTKLKLFFK